MQYNRVMLPLLHISGFSPHLNLCAVCGSNNINKSFVLHYKYVYMHKNLNLKSVSHFMTQCFQQCHNYYSELNVTG